MATAESEVIMHYSKALEFSISYGVRVQSGFDRPTVRHRSRLSAEILRFIHVRHQWQRIGLRLP